MAFIRKIKKKSGTYLAKVEGYRENGKVKQRIIEYLGKEIDGKPEKKIFKSDLEITKVKRSIDVQAIHQLAQELGINSIKNKCFLTLVYSHLLENRSINKMEEWLEYTEIPEILGANVSTKNLYNSLADIDNFEKIESQIYNYTKKFEKEKKAAIIDVTDTYFEGKNPKGKRRRGKDGKVRHLVQVGLAVSFQNGFPIFHKTYNGNLHNFDIYKDMALSLKKNKISSVILDRGMLSEDNLNMSLKLELGIIAGLKKNQSLTNKFLSGIDRESIYSLKNRVKLKNTSVFIQSFKYKEGKLIVVYNPGLEMLKNEINFENEKKREKYVGYSFIYHNTELSNESVVKKYYEKDTVERAFKQLKGILKLRPIRVWLKNHVEGHIKICYLAYAILSLMNYRLRKKEFSAIDALENLKHGYKVKLMDKKNKSTWETLVTLNPKQKKILKALKCCV